MNNVMRVFVAVFLSLVFAVSAAAQQRFRILFGGADPQILDWSGSVSAENGSVKIVAPFHFGAGESYDDAGWQAKNHWEGNFNLTPQDEASWPDTRWKGVVVDFSGGKAGRVAVETAQGKGVFRPASVRFGEPAALLDGRIRVERVPYSRRMSDGSSEDDYPAMTVAPDGRIWVAWVAYENGKDVIKIRSSADGESWSPIETVSEAPGDYYQVALASSGNGKVTAVWSAIVNGTVDLYARGYANGRWGALSKLTGGPGPNTFPRLAAAPGGKLFLVWQSGAAGHTDIAMMVREDGRWGPAMPVTEHPASDWEPSVAVNSRGEAAVAWDSYRHGNYDIFYRSYANGKPGALMRVTKSPDFEAHVSVAFDSRDRLWFAWDNGGPNWGKDFYGINGIHRGESGLYFQRRAQVRVLERGRLLRPVEPLDAKMPSGSMKPGRMGLGVVLANEVFTEYPLLQVDGKGRVWAVVRTRTIGRANPPSLASRSIIPYWVFRATMFDGHGWTEPVRIPFSEGRNEQRAAVAVDKDGSLWVAAQADNGGLLPADERYRRYDLWAGKIDNAHVPGGPVEREFLVAADDLRAPPAVRDSSPSRKRPLWKTYRMEADGKQYSLVWGDLHRHTDLSFDGHGDGSMYDVYRYALDAAGLDFLGPSEHLLTTNYTTDYTWRMVDKAVDIYKIPGVFYPLLNYERTVQYPDGHRNIVAMGRGYQKIRIKTGARPNGAAEDDTPTLWEKLLDGNEKPTAISIPHTSATQMGTDWRYNDERVERLVEMFQGNRDSYEYYGAPRAAVAESLLVGGYVTSGEIRRKGYIWNALAKGYKMGFIASSDHRSTHMSYAAAYTPARNYADIWNSLYARRTYAATDNIIVDFQCAGRAMGAAFASNTVPKLEIGVIGADTIAQIDIIKDNKIVYTAHPGVEELSLTYTDRDVETGEHYYYVRVIQEDNNMAWASPIWIDYSAE